MTDKQIAEALELAYNAAKEQFQASQQPKYASAMGAIRKAASLLDTTTAFKMQAATPANVIQNVAKPDPNRFKGKPILGYGDRNNKKKEGAAVTKPTPKRVAKEVAKEAEPTPQETSQFLRQLFKGKTANDIVAKYNAEQLQAICKELGIDLGRSKTAKVFAKRLLMFLFDETKAVKTETKTIVPVVPVEQIKEEQTKEDADN